MKGLRHSLALRLTIWFLLLSFLPLGVMAIFVRHNVADAFVELAAHHQQEQARTLAAGWSALGDDDGADEQLLLSASSKTNDVAFVLDENGMYVAHPDVTRVGHFVFDDYATEVVEHFLAGGEGATVKEGTQRVFGYATVPARDAVAVVAADGSMISTLMSDVASASFVQLAASLAIVSVVGGAVIWLVVGDPLRQLTRAVERIGTGDLELEVDPAEMEDELEVLALAFNRMTRQIRELVSGLEQHIVELERSEEARKQAEEKYRGIFEGALEGIFQSTPDGRFITANPALAQMLGYASPKELMAKLPDIRQEFYVDPERRAEFERLVEEQGVVQGFVSQVYRRDGGKIWISEHARAVCDRDGEVLYYEGILEDISELKQAEEALRESEERFRQVVLSISDHVYVTELTQDDGFKNLYLSPHIEALTGYSRKEFMIDWHFWPTVLIHPDDRDIAATQAVQLAAGQDSEVEYRIRRADGRVIWVRDSARVQRLDKGQRVVYGVVSDTTARKRAEEALRNERDKAQRYLDIVGAIIVVIDADQTVSLVNRKGCEILGYAEEEIVGKNWFDNYLPPRHRDEVKSVFEQLMTGETEPVEYFENPILTRYGEERVIAWYNTILTDGSGNVTGTLSSGEDITERMQAEEQIRASLQEKEVLLREIHHRVKNNLQLVCALLNLQASVVEDEKALQAFEESQNRVRSLAYIHEQLTHAANMARIDMASYIYGLVDSLRALYGSGDVAINVDVVDVTLPFDLVSSCGLLVNELVSNAMKHAFPKGRTGEIDVALGAKAGGYVLRVSDDGVGLPPGLNLENPASFGLTLVKLLTRQLRGTLKVDRQAGATFEVSFAA